MYVVATPIGNLRDLTLRALDVLGAAQTIAAEDTRVTRVLLSHFGINARLIALHDHNEDAAAAGVIGLIERGEAVALVSDAGTPGISDPGARLVALVAQAGHPVVPIPGPSALGAALSVAGLACGQFLFCGFLPAQAGPRLRSLEAFRAVRAGLIFYEAPHRVREALAAMVQVLGPERRLFIGRELTKLHESLHRCALGEVLAWLDADPNRSRGEFVLVLDAPPEVPPCADVAALDAVLGPLLEELPLKQAVKLATTISGAARNRVYERALALREAAGDGEPEEPG